MANNRTIVFVHGVGGTTPTETWLEPLNGRLAEFGMPQVAGHQDDVIAPDYGALLNDKLVGGHQPTVTWRAPDERTVLAARMSYVQRADELARALTQVPRGEASFYANVPEVLVQTTADAVARIWPKIRAYRDNSIVRAAVQRKVLSCMPDKGSVVLIGHSLGSVVAHDLLRRLPAELTVDLFITLGSPLPIKRLGDSALAEAFPYDRVRGWVNIYDPSDIVTTGRGVASRFKDAVDSQVGCKSHDLGGYASHPAFAIAVNFGTFERGREAWAAGTVDTSDYPQRRLDDAWLPLLYQHSYCHDLSATWKPDRWNSKARFDEARRLIAKRVTEAAMDAGESEQVGDEAKDLLGKRPSASELLNDAHVFVDRRFPLAVALPFLVGLASASPVDPFDVELEREHKQVALERLLGYSRERSGPEPSDREVIEAVLGSVDALRREFTERSGGNAGWIALLGLGLLAATGVGMIAAIPAGAGLAGAALITSTLAAFGPGGMVGGMVTLAALTGTGGALLGGGLAAPAGATTGPWGQMLVSAAEGIARQPQTSLRATLAGILAVVEAQRRLEVTIAYSAVLALLNRVHDLLAVESAVQERIAPGRAATKDVSARLALVRQAIEWLRGRDWPEGTLPPQLPA